MKQLHSISSQSTMLMSSAAAVYSSFSQMLRHQQRLQGSFLLMCMILLTCNTLQIFTTSACLSSQTGLMEGAAGDHGFHSPSKETGDSCTTTAATWSISEVTNGAELQRETPAATAAELQQRKAAATAEQEQEEEAAAASAELKGSPNSSSIELPPCLNETPLAQHKKATRRRFRNRRMLAPNQVCTNKDVSIFQGQVGFSGIPQYIVQIVNTCMSECAPSDIHVYCGWFASALLVNPNIFSRIAFNDCLVNGGRPLSQDGCTNKDISITQSQLGSAAGIPQYSVQIVNTCISDCAPTNIHVYCGWFASSPPPNPNTFTRLAYNDCLVNGGRPLAQGSIVEFQYANSFMYALSFRSANFCR
ncbi:hypothetical protein BDL97_17G004200 [Sphagnum fallax]|nr:hypothetical protein BDL97_17G004200 [Sphagnum fallax]